MKYKIFDKETGKELDYSKYAVLNTGDAVCLTNGLVSLSSDTYFEVMSEHDIKKDFNSKEYQLRLLQNFEKCILSKAERKRTQNVWLVMKLLTQFTSQGGSTSAYNHCNFLGIDPDGYSFFDNTDKK